ncbi:hypothetical protein B0H10DRAFT_1951620 [Mycena sp. CBHHK59/15]|nr:hypothetical protein B0H10DRAFT_1951620 [Mycena sp. CBHHK59/15]
MSHFAYSILVLRWGEPTAFVNLPWSSLMSPISGGLSLGYRADIFCEGDKLWARVVAGVIVLLALMQCLAGILNEAKFAVTTEVSKLEHLLTGAKFATSITLTMSFILNDYRSKTPWKKTDTLITKLIFNTVETGAVTTIVATVAVVLFILFPTTNPGQLPYAIVLVVSLNARAGNFVHRKSLQPQCRSHSLELQSESGPTLRTLQQAQCLTSEAKKISRRDPSAMSVGARARPGKQDVPSSGPATYRGTVLGRRHSRSPGFDIDVVEWSRPSKMLLSEFAATTAGEYDIAEEQMESVLEASTLPTQKLLIVTLDTVLGAKEESSDDRLRVYLLSAEFKEHVVGRLRSVLLDPGLSSFKDGFLLSISGRALRPTPSQRPLAKSRRRSLAAVRFRTATRTEPQVRTGSNLKISRGTWRGFREHQKLSQLLSVHLQIIDLNLAIVGGVVHRVQLGHNLHIHLLLFLRVLHHSLTTLSTEGLLGCLCKQALERNGLPLARGAKLVEMWVLGVNQCSLKKYSEVKRKLSEGWNKKSDIAVLRKTLAWNNTQEMTDEFWGRFAWLQYFLVEYREQGKDDRLFWDEVDKYLAERREAELEYPEVERAARISYIFEELLKAQVKQFPRKNRGKLRSGKQMPQWQKAVSRTVEEMDGYTQEELAGEDGGEEEDDNDPSLNNDGEVGEP